MYNLEQQITADFQTATASNIVSSSPEFNREDYNTWDEWMLAMHNEIFGSSSSKFYSSDEDDAAHAQFIENRNEIYQALA